MWPNWISLILAIAAIISWIISRREGTASLLWKRLAVVFLVVAFIHWGILRYTSGVFLQFLFTGIMQGGVYALIALGFVIIYSSSGVINFAQGELVMLGGMLTVTLYGWKLPLILAGLISIIVVMLIGIALERLAIRPIRRFSALAAIIVTIGASKTILGAAKLIWGKDTYFLPYFVTGTPIAIGGAFILPHHLLVTGITLVIMVLLTLFFRLTLTGQAMRACADNRRGAALCGINPQRMVMFSFALSAALGAASGFVITPTNLTSYDTGILLGLKGFIAAIIGGLGSVPGAILGGYVLGVVEAMSAGFLSSQYKNVIVFALFLLVLFLRPQGLLGKEDKR